MTAASVSLPSRSPDLDDVLAAIQEGAASSGVETWLVGGFVRDRMLGRPVSPDIDLLTVGEGGFELLAAVARRMGWSRPQLLERFGTGQVRGDGFVVEVVRARAERYDPASRRPEVRPGTLAEDIWRRDFTVNALCQSLDGHLVDLCGRGLDDLRAGLLRTPLDPAETFAEDPLRMFRAARFAAQLGFSPGPGLLEAMRAQARRAHILSVERIAAELRKLLCSEHPRLGMEVLREGGLLAETLPEIAAMEGVEQSGYHRWDVYTHTVNALDLSPPDLITRLAVLLHDVGKPPTHALAADGRHTFHDHPQVGARIAGEVLDRLRFSTDEVRAVCTLVRLHLRPIQYDPQTFGDAAVRRLIRDAGALRDRLLAVARADTLASAYPGTAGLDALAERMAALDHGGRLSALVSPLDGDAIMAMAGGRRAGPWIGRVKRALEEAVISGELDPDDAEAARQWLGRRPDLLNDAP